MSDIFDKYFDEMRFSKDAEKADTLEKQIEFCERFLDKHGPLPSRKVLATQSKYSPLPQAPGNSAHKVNQSPEMRNIDWLVFNRRIDLLDLSMGYTSEADAYRELLQYMAHELLEQGYITHDEVKDFASNQKILRFRLGVTKP